MVGLYGTTFLAGFLTELSKSTEDIMSKRKGLARAELFENNAKAYGVVPELVFLMESKGLWDRIENSVKAVSKDFNMNTVFDFPIDQLIENLEALKVQVAARRG